MSITIEDLLKQVESYNPGEGEIIKRAYEYADHLHSGQTRQSGEPYIIHPINVCINLAKFHADGATLVAGMLHDVVEDTEVVFEDIKNEFGQEIAEMVDGVTKLKQIQYATIEEHQVENYRKMFLAMGKDIRVILIKLAEI